MHHGLSPLPHWEVCRSWNHLASPLFIILFSTPINRSQYTQLSLTCHHLHSPLPPLNTLSSGFKGASWAPHNCPQQWFHTFTPFVEALKCSVTSHSPQTCFWSHRWNRQQAGTTLQITHFLSASSCVVPSRPPPSPPHNTYSYELTYVFRSLFIFLPIWGGWRPVSIHHSFCSAFLVLPSHCLFSSLPICVGFPSQKPANLYGHPSFYLEFCRTESPSSSSLL